MSLNEEQKEEILKALRDKVKLNRCPVCGSDNFMAVEGYFNHFLQDKPGQVMFGGPYVPTIAAICGKCGYMMQFSAISLGIIKKS
ncbi:MAG: hypothetical protein WC350_04825 [Candidatus Micrarchaeia archaeon]|jgi:ribosomal protein S27AE